MRDQQPASKRSWRALRFPTAAFVAAAATVVAATVGSAATGWVVVSSPQNGQLLSVSCTSATSCMGVGASYRGYVTLVADTWNGSTWTATNPTHRGQDSTLYSVSCTNSSTCMAVGWYINGLTHTLAETWNGSAWTAVATPNEISNQDNELNSVSCTSPTDCVAVGDYSYASSGPNPSVLALVESWNGSAWSIVAAPTRSNSSTLNSVSCTSSISCVAVGDYWATGSPLARTLVESWNGAVWTVLASPNRSTATWENYLWSVSCTSSTQCVAVGEDFIADGSTSSRTLIESWNGSTWSIIPSPNQGSIPELSSVSCVKSTRCVAVGVSADSGDSLIETWNGNAWSITPSPATGFEGVSCTSSMRCLAVGSVVETGPA
jgi:hypothetical protein